MWAPTVEQAYKPGRERVAVETVLPFFLPPLPGPLGTLPAHQSRQAI